MKSDTTTVPGILTTLLALAGEDIAVSGPGGIRYERLLFVNATPGDIEVVVKRSGERTVTLGEQDLLIAYGGFVVQSTLDAAKGRANYAGDLREFAVRDQRAAAAVGYGSDQATNAMNAANRIDRALIAEGYDPDLLRAL